MSYLKGDGELNIARSHELFAADVAELMHLGYTPKEIDAKLNLPSGRAHDIIVYGWARDKDGFALARFEAARDG